MKLQQFTYLAGVLLSIGGLAAIDFKYKLIIWHNFRAGLLALAIGFGLFLMWDVLALNLATFAFLPSNYTTHFKIGQIPIEEVLFLLLLCYQTLILWESHAKSQHTKITS